MIFLVIEYARGPIDQDDRRRFAVVPVLAGNAFNSANPATLGDPVGWFRTRRRAEQAAGLFRVGVLIQSDPLAGPLPKLSQNNSKKRS